MLINKRIDELNAMHRYASMQGIAVNPETNAFLAAVTCKQQNGERLSEQDTAQLEQTHKQLTELIAPAKPDCIELIQAHENSWLRFLGAIPLVRQLLLVLLVCLLSVGALAMSPYVTSATLNQTLSSLYGWPRLANFMLYLCAASCGAAATSWAIAGHYLKSMRFLDEFTSCYWVKLSIGTSSGLVLCTYLPIERLHGIKSQFMLDIDKPLLACLGAAATVLLMHFLVKGLKRLSGALQVVYRHVVTGIEALGLFRSKDNSGQTWSHDQTHIEPAMPDMEEIDAPAPSVQPEVDMTTSPSEFTWWQEHTRKACCQKGVLCAPGDNAGLILVRGYDCKDRSAEQIIYDLSRAGLDFATTCVLAKAAGLVGEDVKRFILVEQLSQLRLSKQVQHKLFEVVWRSIEEEVRSICAKSDCVAAYGKVNWRALDSKIKAMVGDLHFCGHYTPLSRKVIQEYIVKNDLSGFTQVLCNEDYWPYVPAARFEARRQFLQSTH
ncbi:hypothetical protein EAG18_07260 [Pseudoalteromonas sp. J010]|uniref:hypothetical protein n=1 Tax=Pseudoalteromonas sp. J010 TaxID=998465 RepID=UPI000F650E43|nr:hypothetical protein [Pseudoalteromonas sp. J010]RRS09234.1 hypothetical protein EAG18_07260 [Pseudoalteromonas sp. J010]